MIVTPHEALTAWSVTLPKWSAHVESPGLGARVPWRNYGEVSSHPESVSTEAKVGCWSSQ